LFLIIKFGIVPKSLKISSLVIQSALYVLGIQAGPMPLSTIIIIVVGIRLGVRPRYSATLLIIILSLSFITLVRL
jgi:hypothetical protein